MTIVFTKKELQIGANKVLSIMQDDPYFERYTMDEVCFILNATIMIAVESGITVNLALAKAREEAEQDMISSIEDIVNKGRGIYLDNS
jgi:hypothetical protein